MKKLLTYAAPIAMALSFTAAVPTAATAGGGSSATAQACNSGLAESLGVSVGTCISLYRDADAHAICKTLKDLDLLFLVGARNQGQCIRALR